jgi:hypothetical protein
MVSFDQLRKAKPELFSETAKSWSNCAAKLDDEAGHLTAQVFRPMQRPDVWAGPAAQAAAKHCGNVEQATTDAVDEMRQVAGVLRTLSEEITSAQRELHSALDAARRSNVTVSSDGSKVTAPKIPVPAGQSDLAAQRQKEMQGVVDNIAKLIKDAVDRATKADQEAAQQLRKWGVAMPDADTQAANDAKLAAQAKRAAELAKKAPILSKAELKELDDLLKQNSGNPLFATAFLNDLGPQGALRFGGVLSTMDPYGGDKQRTALLGDLQRQMGTALAAGTDPANHQHVPDAWVKQLEAAGKQKMDIGLRDYQPYGYQILGNLMRSGHYSTSFLKDVGGDLYGFEKSHPGIWQQNSPTGLNGHLHLNISDGNGAGNDPMYGLMRAMADNPEASRQFFADHGKIDYFLTQRRWPLDFSEPAMPKNYQPPAMGMFGGALESATANAATDPASAEIARHTIETIGRPTDYGGLNGHIPDGLRGHISNVIANDINDVHDKFLGQNLDGNTDNYRRVLTDLAKDPNDYAVVYTAEQLHAHQLMHGHHPAGDLDAAARVLGTLDHGENEAIRADATKSDAQYNQALGRYQKVTNLVVGNVAGRIPVPGVGELLSGGVNEAFKSAQHNTSEAASAQSAMNTGKTEDYVNFLAREAAKYGHGDMAHLNERAQLEFSQARDHAGGVTIQGSGG